MASPLADHWTLRSDIDYLNHGSFGATPRCVLAAQQAWMARLEQEPIEFLAPERTLLPKLDQVRKLVAEHMNASPRDVVFVRNATDGVNAVVRSIALRAGDEVLITSHGYNACNNAVRYAAERAGATVVTADIPFPISGPDDVVDAITACLTPRTRWMLVDHVTSPTGIVMPVDEIVDLAHARGIRVMIDGAHGPGMLQVDLQRTNPDYYTANHHKWWCGPKVSGFLFAREEWQDEIVPAVISRGANLDGFGDTKFQANFNWPGTFDPSPLLALPTAIEFLSGLHPQPAGCGLEALMRANHDLVVSARRLILDRLGIEEPVPESMLGSLATIPIPAWRDCTSDQIKEIGKRLRDEHRFEFPVIRFADSIGCLRISAQAYNSIEQYQRLADVLVRLTA
ncbi:aminotransferase class V-fold PLP-dependent enzyme [Aporhodopirellula aestuarii]|uniref:Aminotransferase class V-fold PLP-dependent enzyme n=1 Tax=Aporhodopirellula aestuarii TaxID=2950107 RepID=A0ABT0UBW3_9BACT|nr:aminotransferase class V-fold PLP-dependent enzyme [Aporhodopirellula aestuarii]MCM2374509.1 aminotransferase class V-fold PLP-dependent enzyme [Aporhodopirellula aestuarii]